MLNLDDKKYLLQNHPLLVLDGDLKVITGKITIDAVYDESKKQDSFTLVCKGDQKKYDGIRLSGTFNISIELGGFRSGLPKLVILDKIPKEARRHFYTDVDERVACVCGPAEELHMMKNFLFQDYMELYVAPFLYGQLYFDKYEEWPWDEYAHNSTGILESYYLADGEVYLDDFIFKLKSRPEDWPKLNNILYNKRQPRGHTQCFCHKQDFIRRCHPNAWEGLKKMYHDINDVSKR